MGEDIFEVSINIAKMLVIFLAMVQAVPLLVWVERRGSAFIQMRYGPNRVGPFGLMQLLADAVKFIFKEPFIPQRASPFLFLAAPVLALIPAALALAVLPFSLPIQVEPFAWLGRIWGPYEFSMRGFPMDMGVLYILAIGSLGAYGLLVAGWASGNKYSLMGALRASAQMISYELALGFCGDFGSLTLWHLRLRSHYRGTSRGLAVAVGGVHTEPAVVPQLGGVFFSRSVPSCFWWPPLQRPTASLSTYLRPRPSWLRAFTPSMAALKCWSFLWGSTDT